MTFWFFWWNWEKSTEIESKPCFNADSDKFWSILSYIGRNGSSEVVRKACFNFDSDKSLSLLSEMTFWLFWWNWEKSTEIESKPCFNADSDKFWSILSYIRRNGSSEVVRKACFNFDSDKSLSLLSEMTFCLFLIKIGKIIINCENSMFERLLR